MNQNDCVLAREQAAGHLRLGVATLNSPRKLNALDLDMIQALTAHLERWRDDPEIALVVLTGAGERAFCAGGDIRQVAAPLLAGKGESESIAEQYFPAEYRLDHLIHNYPKPLLAWGQGIVMGGGMGLFAGAGERVVTPSSLLAMPEITIGLFPDVGAAWFLNRLPEGLGLYLGLTGARLNPADALFLGLADHLLAEDALPLLLADIAEAAWTGSPVADAERLRALIAARRLPVDQDSPVRRHYEHIRELCAHTDTSALYRAIVNDASDDPWLRENAERLRAGAPTSVAVIHEQFRRARRMSLAEVLRMDLDMAVQFCRRPDFPEGVRALLVDKDNQPRWRPASLAEVDPADVRAHFESPWPEAESPLADLR